MRCFGKRVGIFALLFPMLLLPMLHLHPAHEQAHGGAEGHRHQTIAHADFFPNATHGYNHREQADRDLVSIHSSQHILAQVDLFPSHIRQSFQFSSVFKKQLIPLTQGSNELSTTFLNVQRGASADQHASPLQAPRFSPPSLRGPPSFA